MNGLFSVRNSHQSLLTDISIIHSFISKYFNSRTKQLICFIGHSMRVYSTDPVNSSVGKIYSTLYITILTQRRPNWFIANIFIPVFLLLLLSWMVYFMDAKDLGDRNELAIATLMALIANKLVFFLIFLEFI